MTILGPLADEPPESSRRSIRRSAAAVEILVTIDKREFQRLIDEIIWLKRRLYRVEDAIEPLVENLVRGE